MRESIVACVRLMIVLVAAGVLCPSAWASWRADNGNGTYSNPLFY
jgi:hypothetical protein